MVVVRVCRLLRTYRAPRDLLRQSPAVSLCSPVLNRRRAKSVRQRWRSRFVSFSRHTASPTGIYSTGLPLGCQGDSRRNSYIGHGSIFCIALLRKSLGGFPERQSSAASEKKVSRLSKVSCRRKSSRMTRNCGKATWCQQATAFSLCTDSGFPATHHNTFGTE